MQAEEHFALTMKEGRIIADYFNYSTCIHMAVFRPSLPHKFQQNLKVQQSAKYILFFIKFFVASCPFVLSSVKHL